MAMDVFMDVCLVAPESVQAAMEATQKADPAVQAVVNVNVLCRVGMTIQTAIEMHTRLTDLIKATKSQIDAAKLSQTVQAEQEG